MIVSMIRDGHVNGIEELTGVDEHDSRFMLDLYEQQIGKEIGTVLRGQVLPIKISHKGRVRFSELKQELRTRRDRDPTGFCLAKRHLLTDLAVALTAASKDTPLSVVFLDMNGLKTINDTHGHHAGDEAIRAYLEAAVATFGEHGEAYRGEGGDEAVVVLPGLAEDRVGKLLDAFVRQLGKDVLVLGDTKIGVRLTASCGSVSTTDPNADATALLKLADATQYRAKVESKKPDLRVSAFAVGDGTVATHAPEGS